MRYIDADELRKESKMLFSTHSFEPVEAYTQYQIDNAPAADVQEVISCLQAENAELKARLEKAVELPCTVGDRLYIISKPCNGGEWFLAKESWELYVVIDIYLSIGKEPKFRITNRYGTAKLSDFGKTVFLAESEARVKLDEMKGGAL